MNTPYEVIEQKELLHEGFAEILADLWRLKDRMGIDPDDTRHPVSVLQEHMRDIFHNILGSRYRSMDDIHALWEERARALAQIRRLEEEHGQLERKGA